MNLENYKALLADIKPYNARLVAISKTKPVADIVALYNVGQRIFGENKVQEMVDKQTETPADIEWHLVGHLQSNKVKYIAPFVSLIHSVDSFKLLEEINKQGLKNKRNIKCLLQVFIADEETKFGFEANEIHAILSSGAFSGLNHVTICGLMGMATNTHDEAKIDAEFAGLKKLFDELKTQYFARQESFNELSIGMSGDYKIALKNGATLIRVGSMIFGDR